MKKYLLFLLFFASINSYSQDTEWSEPVQISSDGSATNIDFTIDNNNVIHCVWREYYSTWFRKIFYAKSEDMGETWSEPFDLSKNTAHWADHPKICTDSKNNIYVIYSYLIGEAPPSQLLFKKFDGEKWSDPVDIAVESPDSEYPCLTIDNNDRVYAFWHNNYSKIYYRYLEDTVWSPIFKPFGDDYDFYIRKAIPDEYNNLHCVGQFKNDSEEQPGLRAVYFTYDINKDLWGIDKILSDTTSLLSIDIDLDSQNMPHIVWAQYFQDTIPPPEASFYSFNDGSNWNAPQQIGIADADDEYPTIALDKNNNTHIIQKRKYRFIFPKYSTLTYYNNLNNYIRIDSLEYLGGASLKCKDSTLFVIYARKLEDNLNHLFFRKKSLTTTSVEFNEDKKQGFRLFQNYPNPFNPSTIIKYSLPYERNENFRSVQLKVYDILGREVVTLVNKKQQNGNYEVLFRDSELPSGIYLYRLQVYSHRSKRNFAVTKKMMLLK